MGIIYLPVETIDMNNRPEICPFETSALMFNKSISFNIR